MNELVSLRECARRLDVLPMTLSRWLRALPDVPVYKLKTNIYLMKPGEIEAALVKAGKLPGSEVK